jgi:hypothetical protein
MSKKNDDVDIKAENEYKSECKNIGESIVNMDVDGESDQEDQDNSGNVLNQYYEYYDSVYRCWDDVSTHVRNRGLPLCEYMTVYNFSDFIQNL